jgi:hypothetical protein
MNRVHWLLLVSIQFLLALPTTAFAGPLEDIQTLLNQSRAQTMAMLSESDRSVLEMRYEDALSSSKELDVSLKRALNDTRMQPKQVALKQFKKIWEVFKTTRDQEIVPLLMAGDSEKARMLAKKVQFGRFKRMNEILDAARAN